MGKKNKGKKKTTATDASKTAKPGEHVVLVVAGEPLSA